MLDQYTGTQGNAMMWNAPAPQQSFMPPVDMSPMPRGYEQDPMTAAQIEHSRRTIADANFQPYGSAIASGIDKAAGVAAGFLAPIMNGDLHRSAGNYQIGEHSPNAMLPRQAMDAAGGVMMGSSFSRAPRNALRSFGGINAKNADTESLKVAQAMKSGGGDRKAIWDKTGWFQGVDGKWRFEIDDSGSNMAAVGLDQIRPLRAHMEHGALEASYPNVMQTPTTRYAAISGPSGTASDDAIGLAQYPLQPMSEIRPVALHEGQHIIQGHEGFAKGGNFNSINSEPQYALAAEMKKSAEFSRLGVEASEAGNTQEQMRYLDKFFESQDRIKEIQGRVNALTDDDRRNFYRSLAGEVEARTVEKRMDMNAAQRRERPPWMDYDIPENEQVVRY